ncbi:hypothetical protein BDV11DRAFT_53063 [Aspergillus similis]
MEWNVARYGPIQHSNFLCKKIGGHRSFSTEREIFLMFSLIQSRQPGHRIVSACNKPGTRTPKFYHAEAFIQPPAQASKKTNRKVTGALLLLLLGDVLPANTPPTLAAPHGLCRLFGVHYAPLLYAACWTCPVRAPRVSCVARNCACAGCSIGGHGRGWAWV